MIAVVWQFEAKPGREREFEVRYGADDDWTAVNRRTRSYLGSSFLHDQNRASRYVPSGVTTHEAQHVSIAELAENRGERAGQIRVGLQRDDLPAGLRRDVGEEGVPGQIPAGALRSAT